MQKTIYLAGGCYWGVQKYLDCIQGVMETEVGFANGYVPAPSYTRVKRGDTGHAETVRVRYDDEVLPLSALLRLFLRIIDPLSHNQQGEDKGEQYRTGIYWVYGADAPIVQTELSRLSARLNAPLAVEALPLSCFYPAEENHQKYLDKTPGGYCHVPFAEMAWVRGVDPRHLPEEV